MLLVTDLGEGLMYDLELKAQQAMCPFTVLRNLYVLKAN